MSMYKFECQAFDNGYKKIAGIDEVGRGPLAGPVVSAAVILNSLSSKKHFYKDIKDSKILSSKQRDFLFGMIEKHSVSIGIGFSWEKEIDNINILQASLLSMARAVNKLSQVPDFLLVDGKYTINSSISQKAIIKGDSQSISIAAASIIAKVTRDTLMKEFHKKYPQYGFDKNKGYPTKAHKKAILKYGPCLIHRKTFKGVKEYILEQA